MSAIHQEDASTSGYYTLALGGIVLTDVIVEILLEKEPDMTYSEALKLTMIVSNICICIPKSNALVI